MDSGFLETSGFAPSSDDQWRKLVDRALKGADFDKALTSKTDDGLTLQPLYPRSSEARPLSRQLPDRPWVIAQRVDDPDPSRLWKQAADDLANGATGLTLISRYSHAAYGLGIEAVDPDAFSSLSQSIVPVLRSVRFDGLPFDHSISLARVLKGSVVQVHAGLDPFSAALYSGAAPEIEALPAQFQQFAKIENTGTIFNADGRLVHNAGGTEAQELAFMAGAIAGYLGIMDAVQVSPETTFRAIGLCLAADQDQLLTMAKARAARLIFARLQEACGITKPLPAHLSMETSYRMLTRRDPETNALRNTIAVFAAGVSGADEISALPHTMVHGIPDPLARRLARNTQTVLIAESHLDYVSDPGAGSGGLEALTDALAQQAWAIFTQIEREGGLVKAIVDGRIRGMIEEARRDRAPRAIVGTTLFPMIEERQVAVLGPLASIGGGGLKPVRLDEGLRW